MVYAVWDGTKYTYCKAKPCSAERNRCNEQLCLRTAKILGIDVPESFIISVGTGEHILFATKLVLTG